MKIIIVGAGGRLGTALTRAYRDDFDILAFDHEQLDLSDETQITEWLAPLEFDVLINAAAFTNVDRCETERDQAFCINAQAPKLLAAICNEKGAKLIHFSTDYVFNGKKREPYTEEDPPDPISVYGASKRAGEEFVLGAGALHLVVRVSWVFGPGRPSFIDAIIERARKEEQLQAISDKFSTPTYTQDIAEMLPQFFPWHRLPADVPQIIDKTSMPRILHFANTGECSWQEYAQFALDRCHSLGIPLKARHVHPMKIADMKGWTARRPVYSVLSAVKFSSLTGHAARTWRDAVSDYIEHFYSKQ